MPAIYISIDEEKTRLEGYNPAYAGMFQEQSARAANKRFMQALKLESPTDVFLLCGGSASGKTEFYSEYLASQDCIVFDSTLPTRKGAEIKIRQILKARKRPIVCAIIPDDLGRAFLAFLGRERKFNARHFYRTHAGSRHTLLWIARQHPEVEVRLVESSFSPRNILNFAEYAFPDRPHVIKFLRNIQMTQKEIIAIIKQL